MMIEKLGVGKKAGGVEFESKGEANNINQDDSKILLEFRGNFLTLGEFKSLGAVQWLEANIIDYGMINFVR
jgi:hypothetical protein